MPDIWIEIDKLRKDLRRMKRQIARQSAILAQSPQLKVGLVREVGGSEGNRLYTLQETGVETAKSEAFVNVRVLPNDPGPALSRQAVPFLVDPDGYRFILPAPNRVILIQDLGSNTGRHIEKDSAGEITIPENSETLNLVVSEPDANFHSTTPATFTGRIYPGQKMVSADGATKYYLIFLAGHGAGDKNHDVTLSDASTLRIVTDSAGKFVSSSNF